MNWQSFIELIQQESDNTLFIKDASNSSLIGKTICGLLNSMNGKLIIGYDRVSIHLTGYEQSDQWIDQFIEENFANTVITSTFLFRSNKKILILDILKNATRVSFMGKYYQIENKRAVELMVANDPILYSPPPPINQPTPIISPTQTNEQPLYQPIQTESQLPLNTKPIHENISPTRPINTPEQSSSTIDESDNSNMDKRQQKALNFIQEQGSIKNKQYRKLFNVSHKTAHIELADLVKQEKIKISGSGRSTCYVNINHEEHSSQPIESTTSETNRLSQEKINQIQVYLSENNQITAAIYADQFNIDLAQAIEELQTLSNLNIITQNNYNNQIIYTKTSSQPLFTH